MSEPSQPKRLKDPDQPGVWDWADLLDPETRTILDRLTGLASSAAHASAAIAALAVEDGYVAASSVGLPETWVAHEASILQSICGGKERQGEVFVDLSVADRAVLIEDPIAEECRAVAYARVPLHSRERGLLGCLCVIAPHPRRWSEQELDVLGDVASILVATIESRLQAVEDREQYFRSLVEGVHDIITVMDSRGTIVYDSPSIEHVLGYSPSERVGGHILDLVHPEDREKAVAALKQGREAPEGLPELVIRVRHRDGSARVLEVRGRNLMDDPAVRGAVLTSRDVTERVQMEEERKQAVSLLRSTLESTAEGILVVDAEGQVTTFNQRFLDLWRMPAEVARTRGTEQLLAIAAEQLVDPESFKVQSVSVSSNPTAEIFDVLTFKDGQILERYSQPQWIGKEVVGRVTSFRDITARKRSEDAIRESEERLRLALEMGRMGIWEWDIHEGRVDWPPEVERMHGREPGSFEGTFEAYCREIHPEDLERVLTTVHKAVEAQRDFSIDYRIEDPAGAVRWVTARGSVVPEASGERCHVLGICADVTDRRQLDEELREAHKMEAVGRLAGGIAHELNNALMEIKGNAQLGVVDLPDGDTRRTEFELIDEAVDRAASITRQLVAIGRKQMLQPEVVAVNEVVTRMETVLQGQLGENIRITTRLDPRTPLAKVDAASLEEVLRNLVLNAGDAMPEGGTVRIETGLAGGGSASGESGRDPARPHPRISVSDTGTGMDEATLARIWEPFFTTRERRMGLGLSTVYGIVKQSGGDIRARSSPGEGSTFTIRLPAAPEDLAAPQSPARPPAEEAGVDTILLVEDEDGVRQLARRVLERAGYRVLGAANAEEALQISEEHSAPVQLLLTDVVLPGMNGPELARHLAGVWPGMMKTIYMSGYTADEFEDEGFVESAVAFISKPFDLRVLVEQVREALEAS